MLAALVTALCSEGGSIISDFIFSISWLLTRPFLVRKEMLEGIKDHRRCNRVGERLEMDY